MNDVLVRARELIGRPVVTLGGEQVGEVKDVVLGLDRAALVGFTLRNPGFLGGPRRETVPWDAVHAVGPDAVMVRDEGSLAGTDAVGADAATDALDLPVITEGGDKLGRVVDVVLETGVPSQVVGLEVEPSPGSAKEARHVLMPLDALTATSEQAIVVPERATHFVQDDLAGFGAAAEQFRRSLEEERRAGA